MDVETRGCMYPLIAKGDGGRSIGPFQIMEGYYNDAVEFNPSLSDGGRTYANVMGVGSIEYSMEVMQSYMNRYATESRLGHIPTDSDIAQIHNGGPDGYKNPNTEVYAERVLSNLQWQKRQSEPYIGCADCDDAINDSIPVPCDRGVMNTPVPFFVFLLLVVTLIM